MSDAYIVRRGGGGAGLNFKVVGGTSQPSNPAENTIWVNTNQKITRWALDSQASKNPVNGEVLIKTAGSGGVEFDALKGDNRIQLYTTGVSQYVNGVWSPRDGRVYSGGRWVDWIPYLYNSGNQMVDLTGGWKKYENINQHVIFDKNYIDFKKVASIDVENNGYVSIIYTQSKIDLTKFNTLHADIETYDIEDHPNWAVISFGVTTQNTKSNPNEKTDFVSKVYHKGYEHGPAGRIGRYTLNVDITSISGKYYVVFQGVVCSVKVFKIWME